MPCRGSLGVTASDIETDNNFPLGAQASVREQFDLEIKTVTVWHPRFCAASRSALREPPKGTVLLMVSQRQVLRPWRNCYRVTTRCDCSTHLHALEQLLQIGHQLLSHVRQPAVAGQAQLVAQPPLPEEVHPAVHPPIGLGCAPYCVVHSKAKLPLPRILFLQQCTSNLLSHPLLRLLAVPWTRALFEALLCMLAAGLRRPPGEAGTVDRVLDEAMQLIFATPRHNIQEGSNKGVSPPKALLGASGRASCQVRPGWAVR